MSQKRSPRRLLACAALSAGVLLGSGAASAETPRPAAPSRAPFAELLDAALRLITPAPTEVAEGQFENFVELEPARRMGNTKGPGYTDQAAQAQVDRARPVQARTAARTAR